MTRESIETRMQELVAEMQKAEEEMTKLRPRVQFLEQVMLRLDGALTVLKGLLEAETASVNHAELPA